MEPESVRPEPATLPDGAVLVESPGGATVHYGGAECGDPLFPSMVAAHGKNRADALANLRLWREQRRGHGIAGREPVATLPEPVVARAGGIRRA